jgi:hypothetical protein
VEFIHETLDERVLVRDGTALLLCDLLGPVVIDLSIWCSMPFFGKGGGEKLTSPTLLPKHRSSR